MTFCDHKFVDSKHCLKCGIGFEELKAQCMRESQANQQAAIVYHSFQCPECGSREWGTSNASKSFREWRGHCQECTFSWPRTDDAKYWKPIEEDWDEDSRDEEESEC